MFVLYLMWEVMEIMYYDKTVFRFQELFCIKLNLPLNSLFPWAFSGIPVRQGILDYCVGGALLEEKLTVYMSCITSKYIWQYLKGMVSKTKHLCFWKSES